MKWAKNVEKNPFIIYNIYDYIYIRGCYDKFTFKR